MASTNKKIKVALGMSGGVDSSVAAKLLLDQGCEVVGFMMKLWWGSETKCSRDNACCDIDGLQDAKRIASILNIPFYVVDVREKFKNEVADYFVEEYKNLRTPNPCVKCNEKIKFGWLLDFAKSVGCDYLATGHYARIVTDSGNSKSEILNLKQIKSSKIQNNTDCHSERSEESSEASMRADKSALDPSAMPQDDKLIYHLLKGKDENKDQSYFLYRLTQDQLKNVIFPVSEYEKKEIRAMAKKWNLPVHEKKESQEICFVQEKDYREFLRKNIPTDYFKSGDIIDLNGNIIGRHDGLINYTIGQRRGIDQSAVGSRQSAERNCELQTADRKPLYAIGFNLKENRLIVGKDQDVFSDSLALSNMNYISNAAKDYLTSGKDIKIKIRYRHPEVKIKNLHLHRDGTLRINFAELQRAITPGQSAVFYHGDEVLGGGVIL